MPDQKIVEYIKGQLQIGTDINKIRGDLMMNGSLPSEIDLAFNSLNNSVPTPPTPTPTPTNSIPNPPVFNSAPENNTAPAYSPVASNTVPAYTPVSSTPPVFTEPAPKSSVFKTILISVIILVLLVGVSAGAFFGYNYYKGSQITLGRAVIKSIEALASGKISSGEIEFDVEVTVLDVGKNYADLATDPDDKAMMNNFKDIAINLNYTGILQKNSNDKLEASGEIQASVKNPNGGSMFIFGPQEFALKYKVFSDNIYVNLEKIPAITSMVMPTFDAEKFLNKWYSTPIDIVETTRNSFMDGFTKGGTENMNISATTTISEIKSIVISLFDDSGAFIVKEQKSEKTTKGTEVTALYLDIDLDKLENAILELNKKSKEPFTKSEELEFRANIEKMRELGDLSENAVIKVLIGKDGYFYGISTTGDLLDENKVKIASLKYSLIFDSINKSFTIERPANAIDFKQTVAEVSSLMSNSSVLPSGIPYGSKSVLKENTDSVSYGPVLKSGILSIQKTPKMSFDKSVITVDGKIQTSNIFEAGKIYTIDISGLKGFTEFTQYSAPAKFVDFTGKFTLYDENNEIFTNIDNIFSSYIGGIPAKTVLESVRAKLDLSVYIPAGNYRWELILTDKKDTSNSVKVSVNFKI